MKIALDLDSINSQAGLGGAPNDLGSFITNILPFIFGISGFLLLIYMVSGGLQMMTAKGDPKAVASAQAKITNGLIGFLVILLSAGIVVLLGRVLGVKVFSDIFN